MILTLDLGMEVMEESEAPAFTLTSKITLPLAGPNRCLSLKRTIFHFT